ncbi:MAG: LysM peptidoglycan-binding domain-containing protein [Candidatus Omnitrophica bacterium]|nr:LysM peptidoglycan-binding domain-containing protein [Candidatus Omnitrophota bacterium]
MKKEYLFYLLGLSFVFVLSGCVVRTYSLTRDRVDQDLDIGNRGVIQGNKDMPEVERKTTRTTRVVEMEMGSPLKFEKASKNNPAAPLEKTEEQDVWGNRGYVTKSEALEITEPEVAGRFVQYTVQKGDTLQKISKKMYGTTKKWNTIYEANTNTLKGPNKIYTGQVLNIPQQGMMEIPENLK